MASPARRYLQLSALAAFLTGGLGSAAAFPLTNGGNANDVVGRPDYVTGFVDFEVDPFFGGATARTRLFVPADVDYDEANERIFVADTHNHRFLVFDVTAGIPRDLQAAFVLGQPDFVTGGADPASPFGHANTQNPTYGCTSVVNACGVQRAYAVAYDPVNDRMFAADPDNHRVLVWDLAAGIANGMPAQYVLGQASFTTGGRNTPCGGGAAGSTNACGLAFPSELEYDATNRRLYVADTDNHRVVVFDLSTGVRNGMAATFALGQPNLTTATANTACGGGASGPPGACGLSAPSSLSHDPAGRLFVAETGNHRVLMFNTAALTSGMAASRVLGQPSFATATANTACGGGASGEQNTNPCGLGVFDAAVEVDPDHGKLYVADTANHRILVFDLAAVTNGEPATAVLGQDDLTTGYDPTTAALGGATTRDRLTMPLGLDYDRTNDRLIAADGGNHRLAVFGSNVGGEPIAVAGDDVATSTVQNANGSVTVDITTSIGDDFTVVLPPGTTPLSGGDIVITVDNQNGDDRPRIRVDARLPPGQTKTIRLPRSAGRTLCIVDKTRAEFIQHPSGTCRGNLIQGPNQRGQCSAYTVDGDPGDNGSPTGRHSITVCQDSTGLSFTLYRLLHTVIETVPDPGFDELADPGVPVDAEPALEDPAVSSGGCDAAGQPPAGALLALLLTALGLGVSARSRSRASSRARSLRWRR